MRRLRAVVVLPLLEQELVPMGWISEEAFLAGYGATQAVQVPCLHSRLFRYCDERLDRRTHRDCCDIPTHISFNTGRPAFWDMLRNNAKIKVQSWCECCRNQYFISALYTPIWTSSILQAVDFLAAVLFVMLVYFSFRRGSSLSPAHSAEHYRITV